MTLGKGPDKERKTVLGIDARIFDFIGASILISILTLWAGIYITNYEYVDQRRDEIVELYKAIPAPASIEKDKYYFSRKLITSSLNGERVYSGESEVVLKYYQEYLMQNGWSNIRQKDDVIDGKLQYSIKANRNEFLLEIAHFDGSEKWNYSIYKKDWIYRMGF